MLSDTCCVVLAGGEGKRMNSSIPKVLSNVLFKPMLGWIIQSVQNSGIEDICIVKGFKHEAVQDYIDGLDVKCESVLQRERKGTAHAVMMAKDFLEKHRGGDVLILGGDSPFIDEDTILHSYKTHKEQNSSVTIISSKVDNPFGYGRIVRDKDKNSVIAIVEEKDASNKQREINEINSGAYWFKVNDLLLKLFEISDNTSQNEYYLTSIIKLLISAKLKINAFESASSDVVLGANDIFQLERLNIIAKNKVIDKLIQNGVYIPFREGVIISSDAIIHKGAVILPNTMILGKSVIGQGAKIGPNSQVINSYIGEKVVFNSSYCKNCNIEDARIIKPFTCFLDGKE